jgi:hypothetical protein
VRRHYHNKEDAIVRLLNACPELDLEQFLEAAFTRGDPCSACAIAGIDTSGNKFALAERFAAFRDGLKWPREE